MCVYFGSELSHLDQHFAAKKMCYVYQEEFEYLIHIAFVHFGLAN